MVLPAPGAAQTLFSRLLHQCRLSLPWVLLSFLLIWPVACGVSYALHGTNRYNDYPDPQWASAAVGGVCALVTCPVWAVITMVRVGEMVDDARPGL